MKVRANFALYKFDSKKKRGFVATPMASAIF